MYTDAQNIHDDNPYVDGDTSNPPFGFVRDPDQVNYWIVSARRSALERSKLFDQFMLNVTTFCPEIQIVPPTNIIEYIQISKSDDCVRNPEIIILQDARGYVYNNWGACLLALLSELDPCYLPPEPSCDPFPSCGAMESALVGGIILLIIVACVLAMIREGDLTRPTNIVEARAEFNNEPVDSNSGSADSPEVTIPMSQFIAVRENSALAWTGEFLAPEASFEGAGQEVQRVSNEGSTRGSLYISTMHYSVNEGSGQENPDLPGACNS
ncbi:MAG: hypothetical protein Q7V63_05425 [Gammaproteobacteria bacterium]|nr:hypothetical protein [Gammaproteobacteria bacterium]